MVKTFEIQLLPTAEQEEQLLQHCGSTRWIWNHLLEKNKKRYEEEKKFLFRFDMQSLLPQLKEEFPWLKDINSQSLQEQCKNLHLAIKRKIKSKTQGFPKFKSKHKGTESFVVPQNFKINSKTLGLPKFSGHLKYKKQRRLEGKAKRISIKKKDDKWFAYICCEMPSVKKVETLRQEDICGIDLGVKHFATFSDGTKVENPKHLEKALKRLKRRQQKLSRRKLRSENRNKARKCVAKLHQKITNQRKDFHWKLAGSIAKNFKVVAMEDLNVKGMLKNRHLAKAIGSAGWGLFGTKLEHQLSKKGGYVVKIDRFAPSTKMCSVCGDKTEELTLNNREWTCSCGAHHDRDINAALNIRTFGIAKLYRLGTSRIYACGDGDILPSLKQENGCQWTTPLVL